ncbi:MAG: V-type ATP synthase subunit D [Candidatus Omnitrophica bacterium CG_4_8_14_3_um_filter_43_15]|nr:MAG: hypothetical protein AUJ89_04070 [Candidatus Omnitrophica bacterium CG1_02_43_210]PIV38971.1 MAG: V-type ATP synthase subunit D [Candidatus Omnitrophica bacterium CG02_land_8_20_14_3_00__42_8]PIW80130.1 MAG: V-type ATP synthase subunit D [Candidatus Omnitrophica bacterium CG_4_8_14_3_um_filter_43_15]
MPKIKFTKGELKKQRDALGAYRRYLPTLQLKKQQLQMEILKQLVLLEEKEHYVETKKAAIEKWIGLARPDGLTDIKKQLLSEEIAIGSKNIAGADIPVFQQVRFKNAEYDLFKTPLWVDAGIEALRQLISLQEEFTSIKTGIEILRRHLRVTTQRVNLFEKVKIPQAEEAIRRIKIYIGDQMTNAVGRCKMAKRKIQEMVLV